MKILNFGSLNIDYVYQVPHFVRPGETLSSTERKVFAGGKGLNQSIAMARAGAKVYHGGVVGQEGDFLIDVLRSNEVDCQFIRKEENISTGHAIIFVDQEGQNSIILYGGANQKQEESHIKDVLSYFQSGDLLLLQNEINQMGFIVEEAHRKGMKILLNPSPMNEEIHALDLNKVDYLILNEVEGRDLTGEEGIEDILSVLQKKYPALTVILTLGVEGAYYMDHEGKLFQEAFKVKAVDTTGAGDTFTGYLFGLISKGYAKEEAMALAAKASAMAVTKEGAEASIPTIAEVQGTT